MAYKKILLHMAMTMYEEEMQPIWEMQKIASEEERCYLQFAKEEVERVARETSICWDLYEFSRDLDVAFDSFIAQVELADMLSEMEGEVEQAIICKNKRTRAYRRKQEIRAKEKMRRNAIDAMHNYYQRSAEDMCNMTRCKRRGGQEVKMPKSRSMKTERIWTRAEKMKLVACPA